MFISAINYVVGTYVDHFKILRKYTRSLKFEIFLRRIQVVLIYTFNQILLIKLNIHLNQIETSP